MIFWYFTVFIYFVFSFLTMYPFAASIYNESFVGNKRYFLHGSTHKAYVISII